MTDFSHRRLLHSTKSCSRYLLNTTSCMLRTGAGSSLPLAFSLLKKPEKLWGTMKRSPVGAIRKHLGARSSGFSSSSGQGQFQGDHENAARSLLGSAELMRKLRAPLLSLDSAKPLRRDIGRVCASLDRIRCACHASVEWIQVSITRLERHQDDVLSSRKQSMGGCRLAGEVRIHQEEEDKAFR